MTKTTKLSATQEAVLNALRNNEELFFDVGVWMPSVGTVRTETIRAMLKAGVVTLVGKQRRVVVA